MTPTTITISGEGLELIERTKAGVKSNELIDLFGMKFAGVKLDIHTDPASFPMAYYASMIAQEVAVVQPAPWSGDGLPPVGTFVRITDDGSLYYGRGESGEVIAHVENCAVVRMSYGLGCFTARYLEAVKTPAQIAAEEREAAMKKFASDIMEHATGCRLPMSESGSERLAEYLMMDGYAKTDKGRRPMTETTPPIMTINDELLAELELLAGNVVSLETTEEPGIGSAYDSFEATANPSTILALLQHVRELKADAKRMTNIEAAARKLAECMDYPWDFMPEQGRESMRKHAKDVVDAALLGHDAARSSAD